MTSVEMYCGGGDGLLLANSSDIILTDCSLSGILEQGVALDSCTNALLWDVKVDSAELGFEFTGDEKEHFIHSVGSNCSTNGKPVYYYTSVTGQKFTPPEASQVIFANTEDCTLENCDLSGNDGILVAYSTGTTISDCRLNRTRYGLKVIQSQDTSVENTVVNCDAEYPGNLFISGSSISARDSRFIAPSGIKAVVGRGSSSIDMYNSTYTSLDIESEGGGILREFWELSLLVRYSDNFTPVMGADILIRSDSKDIYNTIMYNGNDPKTDIWGRTSPVWFLSRRYDHNNSQAPLLPVEVFAYFRGEREWENASIHYYDNNSILYLITSDIRRPPGVEITGLSPVEGKDALMVSWNESNEFHDEISLFRLFIWGDSDGNPRLVEVPGGNHHIILNATEYNLINNESYHINVIAVDGAGFESDPSTIQDVVHKDYLPPESPVTLFNGTTGANNATIFWNKSVSGDTRGYRLYLGKLGVKTNYLLVGEYDNYTNSTTILGLRFETNYSLYVVAFDEANNTSPASMRLNITTGRSKGTLMLIVVNSDSGKMLQGAYAELRDIFGGVWNVTTTDEPAIIPLYGGKFLIRISLDNYTENSTTFNITHENLTRLVIEMVGVADPVFEDDDEKPDDDEELYDDKSDKQQEGSVKADTVMGMPAWFMVFVVAMLILLLLLLVIFLRRRNRHKSRIKPIPYVGPPVMLPPPPPPQPSLPPTMIHPVLPGVTIPGDPLLQAGTPMEPTTMYPYGRLLERPALPPYTGDSSHEMTEPPAPSDTVVPGPFPGGSLDEIFQFKNVPSVGGYSVGTDAQSIPPPPRIIPPGEKKENDSGMKVTLDPVPPLDELQENDSGAQKGSGAGEVPLGKEEVMTKLKSLIETINKKDNSVQTGVPPVVKRSISDITVTLPPEEISQNDTVTSTEPVTPPPPENPHGTD
ncbi:MAG: right-handed parallel beta-helix repeat-containing protein [Candidatus Thermoplasmatota archaeon]|nr:right-handed parallel beta-helix repeat-containing protein [Candidatus Thermoplasmatota archaeon]